MELQSSSEIDSVFLISEVGSEFLNAEDPKSLDNVKSKNFIPLKSYAKKKISLTRELKNVESFNADRKFFREKCSDLEKRVLKIEENLEMMIETLIRKRIIIKDKSSESFVNPIKSEKLVNTIEFNKKSSSDCEKSVDNIEGNSSSTETIVNSGIIRDNLENEIQHKLNNLLKIKKKLSDFTLKLNRIKSVNDLKNPSKLSHLHPSNMSVANKIPSKKNQNKFCRFIQSKSGEKHKFKY